jgi:transcription elongation factor Elf1
MKTRQRRRASKTKYTCPQCGQNAWAKPQANLLCGDCEKPVRMEPEEPTDDED